MCVVSDGVSVKRAWIFFYFTPDYDFRMGCGQHSARCFLLTVCILQIVSIRTDIWAKEVKESMHVLSPVGFLSRMKDLERLNLIPYFLAISFILFRGVYLFLCESNMTSEGKMTFVHKERKIIYSRARIPWWFRKKVCKFKSHG